MKSVNKAFKILTAIIFSFAFLNANLKAGTLKNDGDSNTKGTSYFFGGNIQRKDVESLEFVDSDEVSLSALGSWDASVEQDGSVMASYCDEDEDGLYEISIGSEEKIYLPENSNHLFFGFLKVNNLDLSNFDTSNVTDMSYMFAMMSSLSSLDVSDFDTSNVSNMAGMFSLMNLLTSLDLRNFNTSNVTDMSWMFYQMSSLTNLNVDSFNTSSVTSMEGMFEGVSSLTNLNVENFNTSNVTSMEHMLDGMRLLSSLNLSGFNTLNVDSMERMLDNTDSLEKVIINESNIVNNITFYASSSNKYLVLSANKDSSNVKNITDKDGNSKTGNVATGDRIGTNKVIIMGDTSGDGKINYLDYVNVYNHIKKSKNPELTNKKLLEGEYLLAADMSGDNKVNYMDYVKIYNKIKELKGIN